MKPGVFNRGFGALLATQFFGAANDNLLKGVLTFMVIRGGVWDDRLGDGAQGLVAMCFTAPFLLLSGYAGQFADRHSKRDVTVLLRAIELPIAALGMLGFWSGSLWITLAALVALTCQSAFFGPAKYGMIPELVDDALLSRANGVINMLTNIAVIAGTYLAGVIADRYHPPATLAGAREPLPWLPGAALLSIAAAGLAASLLLPRLAPGDGALRYDPNPFSTYVASLREMARSPLLLVTLAWAYFYLLAGLGLLIIPEYKAVLDITSEQASRLLALLAIAIGLGSALAGWISGPRIEPRLVPLGALGLTVFFTLLGLAPASFRVVGALISGAGFCAGFYIIPLQATLQKLSPGGERGRFLGTANAMSFSFLMVASLLYWVIRPLYDDKPQRIFLLCAALIAVGAAYFLYRLRGFKAGGFPRGYCQQCGRTLAGTATRCAACAPQPQ